MSYLKTVTSMKTIYILRATALEPYEYPRFKVWHFSSEEEARQFYIDFKREIKEVLISPTKHSFRVTVQRVELNPPHHMDRAGNYSKPLELENIELKNHR